ncbi:Glucosidase II beta subunit-like protein [Metarhizium album ARSEF 1941]|uniref:Endoplasmic reticulum lectin n=1 Tax=Metarhizium album (strain ARSEF 1941) TaxID=1081103 RepID=A0A0B2WK08_METAS|nr:Glucosidase II beta subunit-like protein [Metarhizium album ARSEF 1941]KHN94238.1 Glucosidase II beta subunit-like protein [Metarhizium album ARSEF 1941]
MRRLNLLFLAGVHLSYARSPSFSIHDDLLAYPQFEVVFDSDHISEKDAQALIDRSDQHPTYTAEFSQATDNQAYTSTTSDGAVPSSGESDEVASFSYELLNLSPYRYLCSIPVVKPSGPANETENALAKAAEEREHQRAAVKGWELVNKLQGSCLYYVSGWWSYSFCKNREVVQYHAVSVSSNGQIPRRDPNGQEYILGRVPTLPATAGERKQRRQQGDFDDPPRLPAELQIKGDQRYLVQKLEGGTVCDLTGRDRRIEVQYQCVPGIKSDKIGWIKEVVTCSYVMMINTPRLCKDVAFQPPVERSANPINCKLISESDTSTLLLDQQPTAAHPGGDDSKEPVRQEDTNDEADEKKETTQVTVGGVVVGGKRAFPAGDGDSKPLKLLSLSHWFAPQPKILQIIAEAASKEDGGKVKGLTEEELEKLNVDPKAVREMREKLKKLAGEKGWKMQLFQMNEEDEKELFGYVDDAEEEAKNAESGDGEAESDGDAKEDSRLNQKKPGQQRTKANDKKKKTKKKKEEDEGQGSEEKFFNRDEL